MRCCGRCFYVHNDDIDAYVDDNFDLLFAGLDFFDCCPHDSYIGVLFVPAVAVALATGSIGVITTLDLRFTSVIYYDSDISYDHSFVMIVIRF